MGKIKDRMKMTDVSGFTTLERISSAGRFNRWMYEVISPLCKGEILEIGGGIGNISMYFLQDVRNLTVTELREEYRLILENRLGSYPSLQQIIGMDITDPEFEEKYASLYGKYNTVFALNVIEHIKDRDLAIRNCHKLLVAGGSLIILVPAFQSLYNRYDRELGHYYRFNRQELSDLLRSNGFIVNHSQYFNAAGILGWWFTGAILKRKIIPEGSLRIYNLMVPLFKGIDFFTHRFFGLSVIQSGISQLNKQP